MKKRVLLGIALVLTLITVLNISLLRTITKAPTGGAVTQAEVSLCLIKPPEIVSIPDQELNTGTAFSYQVEALWYGSNTSRSYFDNTTLFEISQTGLISFTPANNHIGTHTITITVQDASGCQVLNGTATFQITVKAAAEPEPSAPTAGGGSRTITAPRQDRATPSEAGLALIDAEEQLYAATLGENKFITFTIDTEVHTITSTTIGDSFVVLTIASMPQSVYLNVGESVTRDVNNDAIPDIRLKVVSIANKRAGIQLKLFQSRILFNESLVKEKIRRYHPLERELAVENKGDIDLQVQITAIPPFFIEPSLFSSFAKTKYHLRLGVGDVEPGIYPGAITADGRAGQRQATATLPYILELESPEIVLFLNIDARAETISAGEELLFMTSLVNIMPQDTLPITLKHTLRNFQNEIILESQEQLNLTQKAILERSFIIPQKLPQKGYILGVEATIGTARASATDVITIIAEEKLPLVGFAAGVIDRKSLLAWIAVLVFIIAISVIGLLFLEKIMKRRK